MCHWLRTFPHILYVLLLWRYKLIVLIILLSKYYITFSCNMLFLHCGSLVPLLPPPLKKCIYLYFLEEWWRRWLCFFSSFSSFSCQSSWVTGGAYSFCPLAWRRSVLAQQVNRVWRRFVPAGKNASQMNPLTYWKTITLGNPEHRHLEILSAAVVETRSYTLKYVKNEVYKNTHRLHLIKEHKNGGKCRIA